MLAAKSCVNGGKSFSDSSNNSNKVSVAVGIRSSSKKAEEEVKRHGYVSNSSRKKSSRRRKGKDDGSEGAFQRRGTTKHDN